MIGNHCFSDCFVILMHLCSRRSGAAVTLITRENWRMAPELISILERAGQVSMEENMVVFSCMQTIHSSQVSFAAGRAYIIVLFGFSHFDVPVTKRPVVNWLLSAGCARGAGAHGTEI